MMATTQAAVERPSLAAVWLLLLITAAVFAPSLGAPFHLDDLTIFSHPAVTSPAGWWYVWHPLQTRPLTYLTFWLNYQLGGDDPVGYHAVNVLLHVLATWLLYRLVSDISNTRAGLIAAALFALHPIQVEPVAYVFERATLLSAVFCLISARRWHRGEYRQAAGFFIFALLSKEECVAFPFVLLLIRTAVLPVAGLLCLSLAAGARVLCALELLHISGAGRRAGVSALDYLSTQGVVILRYMRLLLVPYGFTCDPDPAIVRDWRAAAAWAAIIGLAVVAWRWLPHGKWLVAGLVVLAPSSSIFPAEDLAADRRLYLPMVAFACGAGLALQRFDRRTLAVGLAIPLAALSIGRVYVWQSEQRLWSEAMKRSPHKVRPRVLLARMADTETAMRMLDDVEALAPGDPRPKVEKASRLLAAHMPELALENLETALKLAPDDASALNNYGVALSEVGKRDAAVEQFRHALRVDPCSAVSRDNLLALGVEPRVTCR